jgi:ribose transport system permease protein
MKTSLRLSQLRANQELNSVTVLLLTLVLFIALAATSETFLTYNNIYSILYGVSFQFFAVIGFTCLLIMGEIDLSVGSVYGFSGMLVGWLMVKQHLPLWPSILISLLLCFGIGLLVGVIIVKLNLNSMMVTIATMTLISGLGSNLVKRMYGLTYMPEMRSLPKASVGNIHIIILATIILLILFEVVLKHSAMFKKLYYVGENEQTTRIYGIKSGMIKVLVFGLSSFSAAVGGILANARVTYADTSLGHGLEFTLLTAAVLGGASLYGGKGSILCSFFGLIFLAMISNGMVIFNIEPLLSQIIVGAILIASVFIDSRLNREG